MVNVRAINKANGDVRFYVSYNGFDNIPTKYFITKTIENEYNIDNAIVVTFDRYKSIYIYDNNYSLEYIYNNVLDKYKKYFIIKERRKYILFGKKRKIYHIYINAPDIMFLKDTIRVRIVTNNITIINEYEGEHYE